MTAGHAPHSTQWEAILIKLGGLAAMVGGVLFFFGAMLHLSNRGRTGFGPALGNVFGGQEAGLFVLLLVGAMAAILAIAVLYAREWNSEERIVGSIIGVVVALAAFIDLALILAGEIRFLGSVGLYGTLEAIGVTVGTLGVFSLAIVTIALRRLPWWCGVALVVWAPAIFWIMFFGDLVYGPPGDSTTAILLGVPWVVVGYAVFRAAGRRTEQPASGR